MTGGITDKQKGQCYERFDTVLGPEVPCSIAPVPPSSVGHFDTITFPISAVEPGGDLPSHRPNTGG